MPFDGFASVLLQGVAPLVQGWACAPPFAFGLSDCGVAGVALEEPVALLGVALSCVLDGVAGVEGEVVVVVVDCVVLLVLDGLLVVSVLVLCASASVPVNIRPAARIDNFFI